MRLQRAGRSPLAQTLVDRKQTVTAVRAAVEAFAQAERDRDVLAALAFLDPSFTMYADGKRLSYEAVSEQVATITQTTINESIDPAHF